MNYIGKFNQFAVLFDKNYAKNIITLYEIIY